MTEWLKKAIDAFAHKGGFFMFLRAQFASQIASITDFSITILAAYVFRFFYVYATFLGSVCGGIVNCIVNYKWTFKSYEVDKKAVAVKYLIVWICSIFLNTYGTYLTTELLKNVEWLREFLGHLFDDVFLVCKLFVSLLVGFLWNYNMQRLFVYKDIRFKKRLSMLKQIGSGSNKEGQDEEHIPSEIQTEESLLQQQEDAEKQYAHYPEFKEDCTEQLNTKE